MKQAFLTALSSSLLCIGLLGAARPSRNVLLITVDTLRADHLGSYGYRVSPTPNFDRLAREGVVFEDAISSTPLTLPSHASILTGAYPLSHGVRDNAGFVLPDDETTLAEVLRGAGYSTGAFVGSFVLDSRFGLDQGFDRYSADFDLTGVEVIAPGYIQRSAGEVAKKGEEWIRQQGASGRPFFAWMHFYDPHAPYDPPAPWRDRIANPYDGEIAYVDSVLGEVLDFLEEQSLKESTIVVVASDHGESLGEHGEKTHGYYLYEATQHVPLIWFDPGSAFGTKRIPQAVRLIDIAPTLLQTLGVSAPPQMQGTSLLRLMLGRSVAPTTAYAESYYARLQFGWSELRAYYRGPYKYIEAPKPELYNLEEDPGETKNLYRHQGSLANSMRAELLQLIERYSVDREAAEKRQPDEETVEALRSLGYVTLAAGVRSLDRDYLSLPDPKDKIETYRRMTDTYTLVRDRRFEEAVSVYRRILDEDPKAAFVYHPLGLALSKMGRHSEAVEAYRKAAESFPDDSLLFFNLGNSLLRLRRWEDAKAAFESVLRLDPSHFRARNNLATLWLQEGRYADSLREAETILRKHPRYEPALFNAGLAQLALGDLDDAVGRLRTAIEVDPTNAQAYQYLGQAYQKQGLAEKAREAFTKAKRLQMAKPPGR